MESTIPPLTLRADLVYQQRHLKEVVSLTNQQDADMFIVSKDKQLLPCQGSLLALFSPVVARLLSGVPCCSSPTIFLPDFPAIHIRKLLHLLRSGQAIPGENVNVDIKMINRIAEVLQISMSDLNLGPYLENPLEVPFEIKKELNSFTVKEEVTSFKEEKKDEVLHVKQEKENYNEKVEPMSVKQEEIAEQCEYIEEDDRNIDIKDESAPLLSNRSTVLTLDENYEKVMAIEEKQKEIDDMLSRMEVLKQEYMGDTGSHEEIKDKLLNETLIETTCPHSGSSVNTAPHLSSRWVGGSRPDIPLSTADPVTAPSGSRIRQAPPSRIEGLADEVGVRGWQRLQIKEDPQEAKKVSYQKSSEPKRDPSKKDSSKASGSSGGGSSGRSRLRSPSEFMRQDHGHGDGGGRSNRNNNGGGGRARNNNNGGKGGGGARKRYRERSPSGSPTHESKRHRSRSRDKDNARDGYQDRRRSSGGGGGRNNDKDRSGGGRNRKDKVISQTFFLPEFVSLFKTLKKPKNIHTGERLYP